jgi:hypothetical protein
LEYGLLCKKLLTSFPGSILPDKLRLKEIPSIPCLRCDLGSAPELNAARKNDTDSENILKSIADRRTSSMSLQNEQEIPEEDRTLSVIEALYSVEFEKDVFMLNSSGSSASFFTNNS